MSFFYCLICMSFLSIFFSFLWVCVCSLLIISFTLSSCYLTMLTNCSFGSFVYLFLIAITPSHTREQNYKDRRYILFVILYQKARLEYQKEFCRSINFSKDLILALLARLFSLLKLCVDNNASCLGIMQCMICLFKKKRLNFITLKFNTQVLR